MQVTPIPPPIERPVARMVPLPAPPEIDTEGAEQRRFGWKMCPPWLVSFILHMNVLILLGLWQGTGAWQTEQGEVELSFANSNGGQLLTWEPAKLPELDSPSVDLQSVELASLASMMAPAASTSEIALVDLESGSLQGDAAANAGNISGVPAEGGPRGDPDAVRTSIYGIEGEGRRFVYVFDRSASMSSTFQTTAEGKRPIRFRLLDCAKEELRRSLAKLDERHRFHLIFYNQQTEVLFGRGAQRRLLLATPINKDRAKAFLYQLRAQGETSHLPALSMALKLRPEVIFLLTDGEEKDDPSQQELELIANMNRGRTVIHVVQICLEPRIDSSLIQLASENGGQHRFLNLNQLYEAMQRQDIDINDLN